MFDTTIGGEVDKTLIDASLPRALAKTSESSP